MFLGVVIEKVGWFDVPVDNASLVDVCQATEQTEEIVAQVVGQEFSVV